MPYRAAPRDSHPTTVVLACSPLVAWRGLVAGIAPALAAVLVYPALGFMGLGLWGSLLALTLFLLRASVLRSARVILRVDPRRRRVSVRSGQLVRREVELDLSDATAIAVEVQRSAHWLAHLPWTPLLEGRIVVRDGEERARALYAHRYNPRAQARVAAQLATLLDVESAPVPGVDIPLPPGPSAAPPHARSQVLFGVLLVLVATVASIVHLFMTKARHQGRLELRCTSTCRFQGATCLPGGWTTGSYDPGTYLVEVADSAAPGGYRAVAVPVQAGHRTTFECRPDARSPTPMPE